MLPLMLLDRRNGAFLPTAYTAPASACLDTQVRYDNQGVFGGTPAQSQAKFNDFTVSQNGNGLPVVVTVTVKKTMKAPVRL